MSCTRCRTLTDLIDRVAGYDKARLNSLYSMPLFSIAGWRRFRRWQQSVNALVCLLRQARVNYFAVAQLYELFQSECQPIQSMVHVFPSSKIASIRIIASGVGEWRRRHQLQGERPANAVSSKPFFLALQCLHLTCTCAIYYYSSIGISIITLHNRSRIQRAGSLLAFTESVSWLRVLFVSSVMFVPAFVVTILIELLPLRPPNDGCRANWVFWLRFFISSVIISLGTVIQMSLTVTAANLTVRQILFIGIGAASGYTICLLLVAMRWRFPVPFTVVVGYPAWQVARYLCLALAIGSKFQSDPMIKQQMTASRPFVLVQSAFILIYPGYNALFLRLHGWSQVAFILVLSAIKYAMNRLLARVSKRVPVTRTLGLITVELFGALYLFKCMQSAGSILSGIGMIVVDLIHNMKRLRKLHKHVKSVKQELAKIAVNKQYSAILRQSMSRVETRTQSLVNSQLYTVPVGPPSNVIVPMSVGVSLPATNENTRLAELDEKVLDLLLECEHIMLVEFIELAVPVFYSMYLIVLFHLPNAKYYPETDDLDAAKLSRTVRNIAMYAALELVSLLYMHAFLYRKFKISGLHLLASVLERDSVMLHAVFMQWVILVLQFTVDHQGTCAATPLAGDFTDCFTFLSGGVDFSFRFQWN